MPGRDHCHLHGPREWWVRLECGAVLVLERPPDPDTVCPEHDFHWADVAVAVKVGRGVPIRRPRKVPSTHQHEHGGT
jgi:hypothetical protein